MPRRLEDILPASGVLLGMEPEELAGFLLEYLSELPKNDQYFNFASLTLGSGPLAEYAGNRFAQVADAVAEAWSWLMREGLIAPRPGIHEWGRFFVTRRGRRFKAHADLEAYRRAGLLHEELLDGGLASKIVPAFQRGEYDTAVFAAFKEVEIRVRAKGGYSHGEIGTDLMKKAFHPETGPLTDKTREAA